MRIAIVVLTSSLAALFTFAIGMVSTTAEDWPRFRGPHGTGVSASQGLPVEFGPQQNLLWKTESGPGTSSPVVAKGRLFWTSFEEDRRIVHCLDAASGAPLWNDTLTQLREERATKPGGPATPTPVADQQHVYVFFPDAGLACYTHAGEKRWQLDPGPFDSFHGVAASLAFGEGQVLLLVDQLKDSFLTAYDAKTGQATWTNKRLNGTVGGFSTPTLHDAPDGRAEWIVSGPAELAAYDAKTGERRWWVSGLTNAPISVPVVAGQQLFVCEPFYAENPFKAEDMAPYDKNKDGKISAEEVEPDASMVRLIQQIDDGWGNGDGQVTAAETEKAFSSYVNSGGLVAVDLGGSGDVGETHVRWTYRKTVPQVASPLCYDQVLYFVNDGGILTSVDPSDGSVLRRGRVKTGGRKFYASPVAADGKLLLIDTDGNVSVVKAGGQWEVLATHALGEACYATPAIANGRLYIRTQTTLYCFGHE